MTLLRRCKMFLWLMKYCASFTTIWGFAEYCKTTSVPRLVNYISNYFCVKWYHSDIAFGGNQLRGNSCDKKVNSIENCRYNNRH